MLTSKDMMTEENHISYITFENKISIYTIYIQYVYLIFSEHNLTCSWFILSSHPSSSRAKALKLPRYDRSASPHGQASGWWWQLPPANISHGWGGDRLGSQVPTNYVRNFDDLLKMFSFKWKIINTFYNFRWFADDLQKYIMLKQEKKSQDVNVMFGKQRLL